MRYEDENIWLTQKMMATLYDVDVRTINEHIKKIYSDSELEEDSTIRNFRAVGKNTIKCKTARYWRTERLHIDFLLRIAPEDINQIRHLNYIILRASWQEALFLYPSNGIEERMMI